jgi:small subunit ribosomal protein S2
VTGGADRLVGEEALMLTREIDKLNLRLGGIKEMKRLPGAIFVVDVRHEATAIRESNSLDIPVIAMVDTNCDPDPIDYVIPSNDDAIRAIKLIVTKMADAALEGAALHKETMPAEVTEAGAAEAEEKYLGEATLAKIRGGARRDEMSDELESSEPGEEG